MEGAKSMSMKGRGHMPSKLGSTAGKMVARTGQRGAQVKEMMESDNENKNHKKEKDMEIKKESSLGKGGSNEAAATTAATGATATKSKTLAQRMARTSSRSPNGVQVITFSAATGS